MPEMVILDYREGIPIILAEPRPDFLGGWRFWCRYCKRWHLHGRTLGHRVSHCTVPDSPLNRTGYILALASDAGGEKKVEAVADASE